MALKLEIVKKLGDRPPGARISQSPRSSPRVCLSVLKHTGCDDLWKGVRPQEKGGRGEGSFITGGDGEIPGDGRAQSHERDTASHVLHRRRVCLPT